MSALSGLLEFSKNILTFIKLTTIGKNLFKTIKNLIENLEKDSNCLNDITTGKNGKSRRLNKNCIINVFNYLLQKENEIVISE